MSPDPTPERAEAKKIYLRFLLKLPFDKDVITENEHGKWTYSSEELAKEHTLICIDVILDTLKLHPPESLSLKFWKRVRVATKKL